MYWFDRRKKTINMKRVQAGLSFPAAVQAVQFGGVIRRNSNNDVVWEKTGDTGQTSLFSLSTDDIIADDWCVYKPVTDK